jgi:hypothetical protein
MRSVCCLCVPLMLLGNGSINTFFLFIFPLPSVSSAFYSSSPRVYPICPVIFFISSFLLPDLSPSLTFLFLFPFCSWGCGAFYPQKQTQTCNMRPKRLDSNVTAGPNWLSSCCMIPCYVARNCKHKFICVSSLEWDKWELIIVTEASELSL